MSPSALRCYNTWGPMAFEAGRFAPPSQPSHPRSRMLPRVSLTLINKRKGSPMNKKWLVAMMGATALAMSAGAMAQQKTQDHTGWYIGADIGTTDLDGADDDT